MVRTTPEPTALGGEADERRLIEAAQKDPGRFGELYESHFERVYAFVSRRVRGREAAEDLTADVFRKALQNLGRFEWRGAPFAAWLFRIAANAITDRSQRAARESKLEDPESRDASEEDRLEEVEQRARLFRLVDDLPADQRHVLVKRFAEEKSIRQVAQEMRRTEGAVKQLQFRALENLRLRMRDAHG